MNKTYTRIVWENEPSQNTPLDAANLNKMDAALDVVDSRVVDFDTTKAKQSDLLQALKNVTYDTTTGLFVFSWFNGTTLQVDLNIEKIPVNFSMSESGVITMTTSDGTAYVADVSALIKTYSVANTSEITWTETADEHGNKVFTPQLVAGGITEDKLQPNFLADCREAKNEAEASALESEGWAVGQQNGSDVPSTSPYYHNNAKYYAEQSGGTSLAGLTDTSIVNPSSGEVLQYNGTTWENSKAVDKITEVNEYTIPTSAWVDSTQSEKYTKEAKVLTDKYNATFIPQYIDVIPSGNFFTDDEDADKGLLSQTVIFADDGFFVFATDVPSVDVHLRIGGVK